MQKKGTREKDCGSDILDWAAIVVSQNKKRKEKTSFFKVPVKQFYTPQARILHGIQLLRNQTAFWYTPVQNFSSLFFWHNMQVVNQHSHMDNLRKKEVSLVRWVLPEFKSTFELKISHYMHGEILCNASGHGNYKCSFLSWVDRMMSTTNCLQLSPQKCQLLLVPSPGKPWL